MAILMSTKFYEGKDELIVDELLSTFVGGMKTVQSTTTNIICYMDKFPEIKKKLFDEILPPVEKVRDNILDGLKFETVTDFDYLQRCFYEVLRIEPVVPLPTG